MTGVHTTGRGFADDTRGIRTGKQKAARKAVGIRVPRAAGRGTQGQGGWYFEADGRVLAHGLTELAEVAEARQWIIRNVDDGRWYATVGRPS